MVVGFGINTNDKNLEKLMVQLKKLLIWGLLGLLFFSVSSHYFGASLDGDAGCFDAITHQMKLGQRLYSDVFDNKAPGIFYLNYFTLPPFSSFSAAWIIQSTCLALLLGILGRLFYNWIESQFLMGMGAVLFLLFSLRTILFFWPAFFVGGYTEEIGSYLIILGALLLQIVVFRRLSNKSITPRENVLILISGLAVGIAVLVKEPFALILPAIIVWLTFIDVKKWVFWLIGLMLPLFIHIAVMLINGSWNDYLDYLNFAFFYGRPKLNVFRFDKVLEILLPFGFDSLPVVNVIQLFVFLSVSLILVHIGYLKIFKKEIPYSNSNKLIIVAVLSIFFFVVGSRLFGLLGSSRYLHYQIPEYLCSWFTVVILVQCVYNQYLSRLGFQKNRVRNFVIVVTIFLMLSSNEIVKKNMPLGHSTMLETMKDPLYVNGSYYPKLTRISEEKSIWNNFTTSINFQLPPKAKIYIDDPHLGRFYGYLNSHYRTYLPCPYWVFFSFGESEGVIESESAVYKKITTNRNRVIKELNGNPPDFILTSDNQGPYGIFDELKESLTQDYTMLGKFEIGGKIINLFENKSIR